MVEKAGWMVHAYAQPEFDNQLGVFAMWNERIWPRVDGDTEAALELAGRDETYAEIESFSFGGPIEVSAGERITFMNVDRVPHSVVAGKPGQPSGAFSSESLETGDRFSMTLQEPGEYPIFCEHHSFMTGKVIVR